MVRLVRGAVALLGIRREVALRGDEALAALVRTSPQPLFTVDREGRVGETWNPAAERRFGIPARQVRGNPMPIVLPGFQAEVRRVLDRVFRGEPVQEIRGQGLPGQGPSFPMSFSLLPLKGPGGEVVSALALLGEDPEPRTRVTTLAVLLGEKSSLLDAVRSARVVVWSMDPASGRITQVSSAAQEILGLGREALLADPTALRALLAPGDLERFKAARDAALDGRVGTFEALLDQGKGRPGVWTRWTLDMADGRIRGVVQDITEARDLRRRLDLAWRLAKAGGFPADPVAEVVGFVEARGGRVAFEDGKGTAFRVLLPPLPPEDE